MKEKNMKTYTVEWQTTTTHKATIIAKSDGEIYRNFGFSNYDNQTITDEEYIDGSYKIIKIK